MKFFDISPDVLASFLRGGLGGDADLERLAKWVVCEWVGSEGRKYYKVFPAISDAVDRIDLELSAGSVVVPARRAFLLRFPESDADCLHTVITSVSPDADGDHYLTILATSQIAGKLRGWFGFHRLSVSTPIMDAYKDSGIDAPGSMTRLSQAAVKTAVFVHMLADDPNVIEPDILSRDAHKWDSASESERQAMIDRARRRGKNGFTIGREMDSMPHFRRPHFAIRHTGKGKTIPKIVPVKAAVVHREKLTRVPTGHYDQNWNEVEPKE